MKLVDSVKESGGDIKIFSSMHVTGERKYTILQWNILILKTIHFSELSQITGVAAILRFPMPELEDDEEEVDEDECTTLLPSWSNVYFLYYTNYLFKIIYVLIYY